MDTNIRQHDSGRVSHRSSTPIRLAITTSMALSIALSIACAKPPRWAAEDKPTPKETSQLLEASKIDGIQNPLPAEVPAIPIRKRLRPCCAFGTGLKVRVGAVPVPAFRIGNIIGIDDVGPHTYDSGALTRSSQLGADGQRHREGNGLLYTCRGGFIDTAHVRDYTDWTLFLGSEIARNIETGTVIALPDEGGQRRIVAKAIPPEIIERYGLIRVTLRLAQWVAYQLSVWHEIATWYGWSWSKTFPETASSFSPEDLYSNILGVKIAGAITYRRSGRSEHLFNRNVGIWLEQVLDYLMPVPKSVGIEAMYAVDGHWWDSNRRLPDKDLTLRRSFDIDGSIGPWLVPAERMPASLRAICGDAPDPVFVTNFDEMVGENFQDWVDIEIEVDENLAAQAPFTEIGRTISQDDFSRIIETIREQNREEFGPEAHQSN
jgi:hypothetical protein